ncbi:Sugar phosphate permease [Halopenitus malekzadehii]|uniref:Lysosomal dipeptide transporter MFSD1 n=1 Tax=Halopenitus malekzadehii TaxID=1267564 RepID=A0A1H6J5S1_9EURY|nr:MFS transporter [Halopenitus malekzadehii]SEH57439.1 Sugar phosphate permease [Halopenitus malekzadehii]
MTSGSIRSIGSLRSIWRDPTRRRWALWAILAASFLLVSLYRLSTAVLAENLMRALSMSGTQLGTLHAVFFLVYALLQLPTGILVDRFGPRLTAAAGATVMNLAAVWFALAGSYATALAARLLIGLGGSLIFVAVLRFCANWYRPDEFGTMSGISFAVGGAGGLLATTPLAVVVSAAGWRPTVAGLGVAGLVVAAATLIFVRDTASAAGLEPVTGVPDQDRPSMGEIGGYAVRVLSDRWAWAVAVLLYCTGGVQLTLIGLWGIPYVVQVYDVSVTTASTITLLGGIGTAAGPPAFGWLSDRTGVRTTFVVGAAIAQTAALGIIAAVGDPPFFVVGVVFLAVGGLVGAFVLTYPMVRSRYDDRASGVAIGAINGASFFGAATFPTLMGTVLDAYWTGELLDGVRVYTMTGYRVAFAIGAVAGVIAIGCATWLHRHDGASTTT